MLFALLPCVARIYSSIKVSGLITWTAKCSVSPPAPPLPAGPTVEPPLELLCRLDICWLKVIESASMVWLRILLCREAKDTSEIGGILFITFWSLLPSSKVKRLPSNWFLTVLLEP